MLDLLHQFGYLGIFLIVLGEIGGMLFFLPGDTLLFASGILIYKGFFSYWVIIFLVFVSSVIAGEVGYYIGTKISREILLKNKYYKIKPEYLEKTERFFEKYGAWAIIFSRFVPIVRNFINQIAGIVSYDKKKFFIYNIIASILWPLITVSAGFYFGRFFPNLVKQIQFVMAIIVILIALPFIFEVTKGIFRRIFRRFTK